MSHGKSHLQPVQLPGVHGESQRRIQYRATVLHNDHLLKFIVDQGPRSADVLPPRYLVSLTVAYRILCHRPYGLVLREEV